MKLKLDIQFAVFLILLIGLPSLFRYFDLPGKFAWLIFIPWIFAIISLIKFLIKGFSNSTWEFRYILVTILYLVFPQKILFTYYNVFLAIALLIGTYYLLMKSTIKVSRLKGRLTALLIFNLSLIAVPDTQILKYIKSADNKLWITKLSWNDFTGPEPDDIGEMDARISSDIFWRYNRLYNYPQVISVSIMEKSNSWVRPDSKDEHGNLLDHEQLHFDITEWTRREFQDLVNSMFYPSLIETSSIYEHFKKLRAERQSQYDKESNHGTDFIGQINWNKKVSSQLNR